MWNKAAYSFHMGAWSLWLGAAMLFALSTRNPFYLLLITSVAVAINRGINAQASKSSHHEAQTVARDTATQAQGLLLRTVVAIAFVVALLKGLSYHIGATVLFSLPDAWPVIGGPITAEGMAAAAIDGLSILTVLAVFTTFGAGADYYAILRSVPPFMHQVALVTSIAITFVPQTITRFGEIREAQALRGHKVRRIGDLVPLIMPLLAGGMERSMNLAEAMESRGFSRASANGRKVPAVILQSGLALGLGFVLAGGALFALLPSIPWAVWLLIAAGVALVAWTLRSVGAGLKRTRYRRSVWRPTDTPLAIVCAGVLAILLTFRFVAPSLLSYNPFLRIAMPRFDVTVALTIVALLTPLAIVRLDNRQQTAGISTAQPSQQQASAANKATRKRYQP
ncbi:MAG: energy-coupling factor transporter transmembrane component T [Chloroflexota bacterium]